MALNTLKIVGLFDPVMRKGDLNPKLLKSLTEELSQEFIDFANKQYHKYSTKHNCIHVLLSQSAALTQVGKVGERVLSETMTKMVI